MSDVQPAKVSLDLHFEAPPQPSAASQNQTPRTATEEQFEEARIVFDKTIGSHYRRGKTGYRRIGALFLTWADDDMQCKATEVDKLKELIATDFCFETSHFKIPSTKWKTGLHKAISDFCHDFDSPDCLAILYYAGHAYPGKETGEFKLAAKWQADGNGDPSVFFNDIRTCLRLPDCDQLVIMDCCYAAKAFARDPVGSRKFELLTSAAHDRECPAPKEPDSFTSMLHDSLKAILKKNSTGFCTSSLYRELYHKAPKIKPLLFDESRYSYGKIWLRPQTKAPEPGPEVEGVFLNLTLRLNEEPQGAIMNELALHLSFLPHVDLVRFEHMYAAKRQMEGFMKFVYQTKRLRPLIRKLYARRQLRKVAAMVKDENKEKPAPSLVRLLVEQEHKPIYDWSSAKMSHHPRTKAVTWPASHPTKPSESSKTALLSNQFFSLAIKADAPGGISSLLPHCHANAENLLYGHSGGVGLGLLASPVFN